MSKYERKSLFDFMIARVKEVGAEHVQKDPQAFARWFINLFFTRPKDIFVSDGSRDGKVDAFFLTTSEGETKHYVVNSKFTAQYDELAPRAFYDEVISFWHMFEDKRGRQTFLSGRAVKDELKSHFKNLFKHYDEGRARLIFVTNSRKNDGQCASVKNVKATLVYLDDLIQYMVDDIEGAMPHTSDMKLTGIKSLLTPDLQDCDVPTTIVFARIKDLIEYMDGDPYDLLFARNVRVPLGNTDVNEEIQYTFANHPQEFAFSNNGITMICDKHTHEPGKNELTISNPRIVNGSQTLHSVRHVENPSPNARVMIRIIQIPTEADGQLAESVQHRKEIIEKISTRSNRQNPIKRSNLVANDDYQHDLSRMFRNKNLFYERREKEWNSRSRELASIGVRKGPKLKELTQTMASFFWNDELLGPAVAKVSVGALFLEKNYEHIKKKSSPNLVYQVYLLNEIVKDTFLSLSRKKKYIRPLKGHIKLALFSLVVKSLEQGGVRFGSSELCKILETYDSFPKATKKVFARIIKEHIDVIHADYKLQRRQNKEMTLNNYFKSRTCLSKLFEKPAVADLKKIAKLFKTPSKPIEQFALSVN